MFDKFQPFNRLIKSDFNFQPTRYEVCMNGEVIASGETSSIIQGHAVTNEDREQVRVTFVDFALMFDITPMNFFDEFVTSTDRLQLVTIPDEIDNSSLVIAPLKMLIGSTRKSKHFKHNEPYCCNIFLLQGNIAQMDFVFSNPQRLMKFYNN